MHQASVGFHCPDCVRQGKQKVVQGRSAFNGLTAARRAPLTMALVAINVALFLLQIAAPTVVTPFGRINEVLYDYSNFGLFVAENGEWYRLISSAFLHWDVVHLALNMFALWMIGPLVELSMGRLRFGVIYAVSLMAGSAGSMLVEPNAFTVGASGAIYGLLGALVIVFRDRGISIWSSGLGLTLLINFVFTIGIPGISIGGHLGGLVGGLAATWILLEGQRRMRGNDAALGFAIALIPLFFVVGLWAATTWSNPIF